MSIYVHTVFESTIERTYSFVNDEDNVAGSVSPLEPSSLFHLQFLVKIELFLLQVIRLSLIGSLVDELWTIPFIF